MKMPLELRPKHIAVIMDGNGRWAKRRHLPRVAGHQRGVDAARKLIQACIDESIAALTLFAFSSENWQRPKTEVALLMSLLKRLLREETQDLHQRGVKLKIVGAIDELEPALQTAINRAEALTHSNTGLTLTIALNYGGRWDMTQACKRICHRVQTGQMGIEQITEAVLGQHLSMAEIPDPDLLIRTSGEQRLSNFLLWQLAYTEIFFSPTLWPDFSPHDFRQALDFYANRERRFGGTTATLELYQHA